MHGDFFAGFFFHFFLSRSSSWLVAKLMDTEIGKLVQTLKDRGMYDNTLIVFHADNV